MNWTFIVGVISNLMFVSLGFCSIWSLSLVIDRFRFFKIYLPNRKSFKISNELSEKLKNSLSSTNAESIDRSFLVFWSEQKIQLEKGLNVLGTIGSNAPFIGLLGTVLAVIKAFGALALEQSDSSQVMAGISEALLHTAFGLLVAIPAVVFYNLFIKKINLIYTLFDQVRNETVKKVLDVNGR